ncbi:MAG: NAD(P)-binding domain-containing protein [Actinomycetota bacterium]
MTRVAIIGAGSVGRALGSGLAAAGHDVVYGVRDPADERHADLDSATTPPEAAAGRDAVIVAVPAGAVAATVASLALAPGQVLVDATNAVGAPVPDGHDTMGDLTAAFAPAGVAVVKAFNTIGAEHLGGHEIGGRSVFLPICGDEAGIEIVRPLATSLGFDVVSVGGREQFGLVEAHAALWIRLAFGCGWGRSFGFGVLGR